MRPAEKRELIKNLGGIGIFVFICSAYTYGGQFLKPKIDPKVSAEAARAMKEQNECSQNVTNKYLQPSLELSKSEIELQKTGKSTVGVVLTERRLKEEECIQQATCEYLEANKQHNQMMFDLEFNSCLDDYKEEAIDTSSLD